MNDFNRLKIFTANLSTSVELPVAESGVVAGFPSPAEGYLQGSIDLNKEIVGHPATTFLARVEGNSMRGRGIEDGDLVVIDKSLEPADGDIVVGFIDGDFTMKTFRIKHEGTQRHIWLEPANPDFPIIPISEEDDFTVWGVVTYTIKRHR